MLLIGVLYLIPVKPNDFTAYYPNEDHIKESLFEFRTHPTKTLSHDSRNWDYLLIGEGSKTLLFLHGMGGAYDIWFQQIEALADSFHIISLTLPEVNSCLLYTSPSPRDATLSRMPSSA